MISTHHKVQLALYSPICSRGFDLNHFRLAYWFCLHFFFERFTFLYKGAQQFQEFLVLFWCIWIEIRFLKSKVLDVSSVEFCFHLLVLNFLKTGWFLEFVGERDSKVDVKSLDECYDLRNSIFNLFSFFLSFCY